MALLMAKRGVTCNDAPTMTCMECGFGKNADVVGALNVIRAGHARFAGEVSGTVGPTAARTHRSDS